MESTNLLYCLKWVHAYLAMLLWFCIRLAMHAGQYLAIWQLWQLVPFHIHVKQQVIALDVLANHYLLSGVFFDNWQTNNAWGHIP